MSWGVLGGLLGAGGATVYITGANPLYLLPYTGSGSFSSWQQPTPQQAQVDELRRLVERMAIMQQQQPGAVIIQGQRTSLTGYLYLGCLAGAGYVYIRMRGWKLSGLLYVTRASMKEALSSIETGMEQLRQYVGQNIPALQDQVDLLHLKQDKGLEQQRDMKAQITEVHGDVNKLEGRLDTMQANFLAEQETANEGILLLCRVIQDLMRGNSPSKTSTLQDLDRYVREPRYKGMKAPGLESLLANMQTSTPRGNNWPSRMLDRSASTR